LNEKYEYLNILCPFDLQAPDLQLEQRVEPVRELERQEAPRDPREEIGAYGGASEPEPELDLNQLLGSEVAHKVFGPARPASGLLEAIREDKEREIQELREVMSRELNIQPADHYAVLRGRRAIDWFVELSQLQVRVLRDFEGTRQHEIDPNFGMTAEEVAALRSLQVFFTGIAPPRADPDRAIQIRLRQINQLDLLAAGDPWVVPNPQGEQESISAREDRRQREAARDMETALLVRRLEGIQARRRGSRKTEE